MSLQAILRPTHAVAQADAVAFQSWLHARQFPSDCSRTVGFYTRQDYFHVLGLGAQMVSLKYNLLHALLQNRVYHFPTSHYVNPIRCPSRSFDCYFEKPSNCSRPSKAKQATARSEHRKAEEVKIHWCFDLPRRKLTRIAGLQAVHASEWYHAQLAAFLYRPNAAMRAMETEVLGKLAPHDDGGLAGNRSRSNGTCVAMHVRRTDKHTEDHRTRERSFKEFGQVLRSWAYWKFNRPAGQLNVLLGSEDKETFSAMPPLLLPSSASWIPESYFVMDMTPGKQFKSIKQGNSRLAQLYGVIEDEVDKLRKRRPPPDAAELERRGLLKDEGMVLILQILLMADCEAFIGSYSSNVAILVHDLMSARRLERQEELHLLDINGRVYCGCGASFCMQLERKASREPKKHVKQLVEAFPRSYGNPLLGPAAGEAEPPRKSKRLGKGKGGGRV